MSCLALRTPSGLRALVPETRTGARFDAMESLRRHMPVWIATSGIVAVVGWIVAQSTDDNTPPYDEGLLSTAAWVAFLAAGLLFIVLCSVALVLTCRRQRLHRR